MRNFFSVCLFQSDYVDKVGIGMTLIITIIYLPSLMMMRCTTRPQIAACLPHASLPNLSAAVARCAAAVILRWRRRAATVILRWRRRAATARCGNIPTQSRRKVWKYGGLVVLQWALSALPLGIRFNWSAKIWGVGGRNARPALRFRRPCSYEPTYV